MTSILMNQSPEDQFLYWRQDMEKKQEEQVRQMKQLQDQAEMTSCGPRLKKSRSWKRRTGERPRCATDHPRYWKGPIPPKNVDTPANNELFSGSSLSLNL